MRKLTLIFLAVFFVNLGYSQDRIITVKNDTIISKIIEVSTSEIKYRKYNNLNGPLYSILKSDVYMLMYENGTSEIFKNDFIILDEEFLKISRGNPNSLLKKGNNVYIEIPDEASRAGEKYFIDALKEWGYWNVVDDVNNIDVDNNDVKFIKIVGKL